MRFKFDALSFWLGVIVSSIFWWMIQALKPTLQEWREQQRKRREKKRQRSLSGLENGLREAILRQAQGMHLAGSLFALDEIITPPYLVAAPAQLFPATDEEARNEQEAIMAAWDDITNYVLPHMPDWPEMAAAYHAPSLRLDEALSKGANLSIAGQPGSGKTTALAWLASQTARQAPDLHPALQDKLAFIIHAAEVLSLPPESEDLLQPIRAALLPHTQKRYQGHLEALLPPIFQQGRALLLLDGLDELPRHQIDQALAYLAAIQKAYPQTQMVATTSFHYIDGLLSGGFVPLSLRPWDANQRHAFVQRWQKLWETYVLAESWAQELPPPVDSALLNAWLQDRDDWLTPLELTLRVWALYAGDLRGPSVADALETHIYRLLPENIPFQAVETLGLQIVLNQAIAFTRRDSKTWLKTFEEALAPPPEAEEEGSETPEQPRAKLSRNLTDPLRESGLLVQQPDGRLRFSHSLFAFYLAGRAAAQVNVAETLRDQPDWQGKFSTLHYLAAYGQPPAFLDEWLASADDLLQRNLLEAARWLRDAPPKAPWRSKVLVALAQEMSKPHHPPGLRGRLLSAAALSRTPGVLQLFLKQIAQGKSEWIPLNVLGVGILGDPKAIATLRELLEHPSPTIYRAAALALAAIDNPASLEALAVALVNGHDGLRQAVAEALANHAREGHPTLQEAARREAKEDVPLRRAAVYGLARIPQAWAQSLLDELQYDEEWVVRNAAIAFLKDRQADNPYIPQPLTPPAETPWLLAFAARQGMGISPRQDPTPILIQALQYGEPEEKLAAITFLRVRPSEGVLAKLYEALRSDDEQLQQAAYTTLLWIAASGVSLPPLRKYGLA